MNYTVYLIIIWALLLCITCQHCRSRKSLIESTVWVADNYCHAVYSLMILFLSPQQIAPSNYQLTSTNSSKITYSSGKKDIQKANLLKKGLTEILYIIFGECRGRVRVGGKVIHFNRAVSLLLATFPFTHLFSVSYKTLHAVRVCVSAQYCK